MKEKTKSITEGLGIETHYFENCKDIALEQWNKNETISDALLGLIEDVRDESFGIIPEKNISSYEKKLILAGFFLGMIREKHNPPDPSSFLEFLMKMKRDSEKE